MPTVSFSLAANTDDGWGSVGGGTFDSTGTSTSSLNIITHSAGSQGIGFFRFPLANIPSGSVIQSAYLRVKTTSANQAWSNQVIGVENNLTPAALSSSSPNRPIDRYASLTAAAIACTWSTDALGFLNNAAVPINTVMRSPNIASLIQPLVNNASWNRTSNNVVVFVRAPTGTPTNAWLYPQGSGNADVPTLVVTYTTSSMMATNITARSSGFGKFRPLPCLARWHGDRVEQLSGSPILPYVSGGAGDIPFTGMSGVFNPNNVLWNNGNPAAARAKHDANRVTRVDGRSLYLEDYLSFAPKLWWDIDAYQDEYDTVNCYSARFYHRYERNATIGLYPNLVRFQLNAVDSWYIYFNQYVSGSDSMRAIVAWSGGSATGATSYNFNPEVYGNAAIRWEIQVDASRNPKVLIRAYLNDSTTPVDTFSANPTTVEMNRMLFGDFDTSAILMHQHISDVELWAGYDLNHQFQDPVLTTVGAPYVPQVWEWFETTVDGMDTLEDLGTVASIAGDGSAVVLTSPTDPLTTADDFREHWTPTYTSHPDLSYGSGVYRKLNLFIPPGTPPAAGWPVFHWTHGGFWTGGDRGQLPDGLRNLLLSLGWAVSSIEYNLLAIQLTGSYPAWNLNAASARYPTMVLETKMAVAWLQASAQVATYNLDPARQVVGGYSAGAYNAGMVACTRELDNDGSGRSFRLANASNQSTYSTPNVADPVVLGAYIAAAPVDLQALRTYDPTTPNWPIYGSQGSISLTASLFMGSIAGVITDLTNTSMSNAVARNTANLVPLRYTYGGSDMQVPARWARAAYGQEELLSAAFTAAGVAPLFSSHCVPEANHANADTEFDPDDLTDWLLQW